MAICGRVTRMPRPTRRLDPELSLESPMRELSSIIREGTRRFGTKQALAKAMNVNPTRLSRLEHHGEYSLNIENCLRLAKLTHIPASDVLRAAGKAHIADLIESLYARTDRFHETPTATADS